MDYYEAYGDCPIGIEYTDMLELEKIYNVLQSGRKDTIGEAIQAVLDDEHKMRVEEARKTRESAEQAAREAKEANKHTKEAEKKQVVQSFGLDFKE